MISNKKISNSKSSINNLFTKSNDKLTSNIFLSDKGNKDLNVESFSNDRHKFDFNNLNVLKIITFIIISILLLSFIGINIFYNLGEITDYFVDFTKPVLGAISYLTGETIKTSIDETTSGSNTIVGGISSVTSNILNTSEKGVNTIVNTPGEYTKTGITKLQDKISQKNNIINTQNNNDYIENSTLTDEYEETQDNKDKSKSGYCYIGSQGNKRYCAEISESSKCMSGDIYPTLDICVNPNIR
jgi:hypothetical protein